MALVLSMGIQCLFGVFDLAMTPFQALALVSRSHTAHTARDCRRRPGCLLCPSGLLIPCQPSLRTQSVPLLVVFTAHAEHGMQCRSINLYAQ